jgi:geranylgeranyl diphosphate synthase type II
MSTDVVTPENQPAERVAELRDAIEEGLEHFSGAAPGCPSRLHEAMRYSLLAPGKRFRPLLTLLASDLCGGSIQEVLPAACAVEMVHCYSLIHDDLPAMDDDDLRRGRPTCHIRYGEALAILSGDALLTLAFETLANHVRPNELAGRCCGLLASASGAGNLVGGQADDMFPDEGRRDQFYLESIHRRKTGALIVAALQLGAVVSRADDTVQAALERFGSRLGLSFQVADDLLDVEGHAADAGKRLNKDADRGKRTFPGLLGSEGSARYLEELVDDACSTIAAFGPPASALQGMARAMLQRVPNRCQSHRL